MTTTKQITAKYSGKCARCGGIIPSGARCEWDKDAGVRHIFNANAEGFGCPVQQKAAAIAPSVDARENKSVTVTMGVFKKDGRVYVVKPNKEKTRVYAKEIVESPARMTENGAVVDFEARYAPGIVFKLTEADRWNLADAKDFLTKFARCIVCGRHLKAAKSVERSIGPVCAGYFKSSSHVNGCAHHDSTAPKGAVAAATTVATITPESREADRTAADDMIATDAINNTKLVMTDDQRALLAELQRLNAKSRAWVAEDAQNRWAGILTEDIAYWAQSGITSVSDLDAMQAAEDEKERRKASYNYDDVEQLDRKISGIKPNEINSSFRLAALRMRNS